MAKNQAGMVVIGAGLAGARACINLRANDYQGPITLIGEEALMPYDRPPLSKSTITEDVSPAPIWLMDEGIASSLACDVKLGSAAAKINPAAKSIDLTDGSSLTYEKLLLATGAKPRQLTCPGGEHALVLRNFSDAATLRQRFQHGSRIAIIGGGFIGLELASSAIKRGCIVTLIEAQPRILMRGVTAEIAKIVHDRHVAAGVMLVIGTGVAAIDPQGVTLIDGRVILADTVVAGIGAAPEASLAASAGLTIENGIACNAQLQSSDPDIFAAGDCCSFIHEGFAGRRLRFEAWRSAQDQAATAVSNMLGGSKAHTSMPWFWSDQYDLSLQIAGMADMGTITVNRVPAEGSLLQFHLNEAGQIKGASGIGLGNSIARDIKLSEMMIAKNLSPAPDALADAAFPLKSLLKG